MDKKYLKELYKKVNKDVDIYLVALGVRPACYIMGENTWKLYLEFYKTIPNIIPISQNNYLEGTIKYSGGFLININHYKKASKFIEKLEGETERCKIQTLIGKIIGYPCAGCIKDITSKENMFVTYYVNEKKENMIYSFICKLSSKKNVMKELKLQLLRIDEVLYPLKIKVQMMIEYSNQIEEPYKTEVYKVE